MKSFSYVFLAGIGNSEPEHWQSHWARALPRSVWVKHQDWENPVRDAWVSSLEQVLGATAGPKILVAHSLGCLLAAEAADILGSRGVAGAFLVAVPDTQSERFPASAIGFRPALQTEMCVPSLIVASANDPYGSFDHAERVAKQWGSELVAVGDQGHINLESRLLDWPRGKALLTRFTLSLELVPRAISK